MTTSGIHAGMLYNYGEQGKICFVDDRGAKSPLDNPQITQAIKVAEMVVFPSLDTNTPQIEFSQQILERLLSDIETNLKPNEIEQCINKLEEILNQVNFPVTQKEHTTASAKMTHLLAQVLYWALFPHNKANQIKSVIDDQEIKCISMVSGEEINKIMNAVFEFLVVCPSVYPLIKDIFCNNELVESREHLDQHFSKFWDRGELFTDTSPSRIFTPKNLEAYAKKLIESTSPEEMKNLMKKFKTLGEQLPPLLENVAQRVDDILNQNPNVLFVLPSYVQPLLLEKRKIEMVGPIKEPIKPRGFLWEIKKAEKVVGYFMGSMHRVPHGLLKQFTANTLNIFNSCDTLAVEADPTNEENKKTAFKILISKFGVQEKEKFQLFLNRFFQENDIQPPPTDSSNYLLDALILFNHIIENKIGMGIDLAFIEKAKDIGMPIISMESIQGHIEAEMGTKEDLQVQTEVSSSTDSLPNFEEYLSNHQASMEEQTRKLVDELLVPALPEKLDMLFDNQAQKEKESLNQRNIEMINTVNSLILQGKKPFSIAGCLHFAGPFGMHKLMQAMGYQVRQIIVEEML